MAEPHNGRARRASHLRDQGPGPQDLARQQVLIAAGAAVQGWEYRVCDPAPGADGRWRGVDDDHGED